jgi:EAL and modified HD-GYP domain-containing signal transduction protein
VAATPTNDVRPLIHVGRQPIYDRSGDVIAYELLFRDAAGAVNASQRTAHATSRVIVSAFTEFGLDQLAGSKACFINVTREFLTGELPVPFDSSQAVLEIVESVQVDDAVVEGVTALIDRGFTIALDDFVWDGATRRLLDLATYVKIDMLQVAENGPVAQDGLRDTVRRCRQHRQIQLIAERLETEEHLQLAFELGFDFFQGHVLGRPHVMSRVSLSPARLSRLQLAAALSSLNVDFDEVVSLIMRDPTLSYRLLHATNSSASGLVTRVSSVREAAVLLGLQTVRNWVVLMLFSDLTDATEHQLEGTMTRARFCQLIAEQRGLAGEAAFTVGLLSCISELIAQPSTALVAELPLAPEVESALTNGTGQLGLVLNAVQCYERGQVAEAAQALDLEPAAGSTPLVTAYLSAVGWSTRIVDGLPAEENTRRAMPGT